MLTKICLVLAILASAGTLVLTHIKVDEKIKGLNATIDTKTQEVTTANDAKAKVQTDLTKTKADLEQKTSQLTQATKDADDAKQAAAKAEDAADKAKKATAAAEAKTEEVKAANKGYFDLNKTPEQIKAGFADLAKTKSALDATTKENGILAQKERALAAKVKAFEEMMSPGPAMPGLKGVVVAVDPKWDFVIIDAGEDRGALANGELKVSRDGKLVARLRISKVAKASSVANVIQGSKVTEIIEGDQVLY